MFLPLCRVDLRRTPPTRAVGAGTLAALPAALAGGARHLHLPPLWAGSPSPSLLCQHRLHFRRLMACRHRYRLRPLRLHLRPCPRRRFRKLSRSVRSRKAPKRRRRGNCSRASTAWAKVEFDPRERGLKCPYCGHITRVEDGAGEVLERSFKEYASKLVKGHVKGIEGRSTQTKCG